MTYFKIPTNKYATLTQKSLKVKFDLKNIKQNNICCFSLNKYLNSSKKKIDEVLPLWDNIKIYTNPYEFVHTNVPNYSTSVCKYKPISRAFFKLLEMYNLFGICDFNTNINTFHLAEGPGGFLEATMYTRKNKNDNYYGITLLDSNNNVPGWKKSKKFLEKYSNIFLEKGLDNTGNIFNEENYIYLKNKFNKKFEVITGDGGIDFSADYNDQENAAIRLILTQVIYALTLQKRNGSFILKMFDLFSKISIDIIYILSIYYEKVYIVKPYTSRYANSEKYIVCINYHKSITEGMINKFKDILKILNKIDFKKYNIVSLLDMDHSLFFMNNIEEINTILGQRQIENILYTIKIIKNIEKSHEKINKFKTSNILKCIKWCNTNNIEYNSFDSIVSPKNIFLNR